ncbi:S9 family peptidase [Haladaptatus sp. ZSTT2]|uniref:S9 family peptidase n=1 Tax=Haladaptatus sp. ZSTT2 TaxID=3120515 RepID=UPI00300F02CF
MVYDVERYLNIRSAGSASFGPHGELAFLMDTTGTSQIWSLHEPGRWPEQRTFYDERITFASWSPENPELIFGMDEGGNEREQLFRLDSDGLVTALTDTPEAKHWWGGWSHDGERFAFSSNRREGSVFDIYVQGRDETGAAAELVYEGDGWLTVGGWSPDDTRLIVSEAHSSFDQDVYVLDVETGELTHVTPHEGHVRYGSVQWGPDGESLYLVTDRDSDLLWLARLPLDTLELEPVVEDPAWNVAGAAIDEDTGRIIYARNVEGYTSLTVGDLTAPTEIEEYPEPALPRGVQGGISFNDDASAFSVTVTGSSENANVYVVDVETGDAERWTNASTAGIQKDTFREPEVIRYESFDGREIPAFFTLPQDARAGATPVVVDIHGGPESQRRPSFNPVKQYLVNRGYAIFEPNVRGSTGYGKAYTRLDDVEKRMDSVADIKAAVEWLHAHPSVDPDRIAVMGGSYGGFMALAALTEYPDLWAAGIDIVGIANFITFLQNTGDWRRKLREAEYGSLTDDREFLESISPINNIDAISAPLLVLHGKNDPRVPVGEAEQIAAEASKHVPVEKHIFDDEGHGFSKIENRVTAYTTVADFLDTYV